MEYKRQGHCVYYTEYHLVITTKYRRKVFTAGVKEYFRIVLKRISEYYPELTINEVNTDMDHAHLLVSIPPKMSVSRVVNVIKSNTGRALREKFEHLKKFYWGTSGVWSEGYFVTTVGINESVIRKYIQYQGQEDNGQAKLGL